MSDTKWTPGEWTRCDAKEIVGESGHGWFVRVSDKRVISVEGRTEVEANANAHLIAAAPELYEALWDLFAGIHSGDKSGELCVKCDMTENQYKHIEDVLAKARSES